jgi:CheY-like chemotaxis protein
MRYRRNELLVHGNSKRLDPYVSSKSPLLIVEDDFDIRDTLAQILEEEGYRVLGASNGQEALDQLKNGEVPCLILLDLMMPVMNGWQFRAEQLKDPRLAAIPVVIISADAAVHEKVGSLSAVAVMKKPIQLERLLEIVGKYC